MTSEARRIANAIIQAESGGRPQKGASGEDGVAQHLPETWKARSKQCLGYVAPMTVVNETYVLTCWVQKQLDRGYSAYEIALIQNSGKVREIKGINSMGVPYDSKAYATSVISKLAIK